jgi:hypothetical protein
MADHGRSTEYASGKKRGSYYPFFPFPPTPSFTASLAPWSLSSTRGKGRKGRKDSARSVPLSHGSAARSPNRRSAVHYAEAARRNPRSFRRVAFAPHLRRRSRRLPRAIESVSATALRSAHEVTRLNQHGSAPPPNLPPRATVAGPLLEGGGRAAPLPRPRRKRPLAGPRHSDVRSKEANICSYQPPRRR